MTSCFRFDKSPKDDGNEPVRQPEEKYSVRSFDSWPNVDGMLLRKKFPARMSFFIFVESPTDEGIDPDKLV
jgi:hypothetical protein